jgi:hypothetical protein
VQQNDFAPPPILGKFFLRLFSEISGFLFPTPVKLSFCCLRTEFFLMSRYAFKHILILKCMVFRFIVRKRQSHLLPDFDEGLSAVGKSKKEKISV